MKTLLEKVLRYCRGRIHLKSITRSARMLFNGPLSFHLGRCPAGQTGTVVVFFPWSPARLHCGLAGLISVSRQDPPGSLDNLDERTDLVKAIEALPLDTLMDQAALADPGRALGCETIEKLFDKTRELQRQDNFVALFKNPGHQDKLQRLHRQLEALVLRDARSLERQMGQLPTAIAEAADQRIVRLKDAAWCLKTEILDNIEKTRALIARRTEKPKDTEIRIYRSLNAVLNSIDRLEVRGRDSAGISLLFILDDAAWGQLESALAADDLTEAFNQRKQQPILGSGSISVNSGQASHRTGITLTYKVAAEIGSLGDNVRQLRAEDRSRRHPAPDQPTAPSIPHACRRTPAGLRWAPSALPIAIPWTMQPRGPTKIDGALFTPASTATSTTTWRSKPNGKPGANPYRRILPQTPKSSPCRWKSICARATR